MSRMSSMLRARTLLLVAVCEGKIVVYGMTKNNVDISIERLYYNK